MQLIFDALATLFSAVTGFFGLIYGFFQSAFQLCQVAFEVFDELPAFMVVFPTGVLAILINAVGIHIVRTIFGR